MRFTIKEDPRMSGVAVPMFFVSTWLTMLALGAIGHRLNVPYLFKFDFWTIALVKVAASGIVKANYVIKWIGETK